MATTEIEKLERRYAENPQGLTFAPLAEVHRKNGEVARALELLKAGLELHPNYIPASIVLGRCHWDLGDLPAAEAAFAHVLRLDDENVIALKSLADINERLERFGEAQRWLNRLLTVDRSNEEARQQLARLESAKLQPAAEPKPQPAASEPAAQEAQAGSIADGQAEKEAKAAEPNAPVPALTEPRSGDPASRAAAAPEPPPEPGLIDLTAELAEPKTSDLEFLDTSKPDEPESPPEPVLPPAADEPEEPASLPGLISQEFVPPKDGSFRLHPELTHDFGSPESGESEDVLFETSEEVELHSSGASEFRVPNAAEDFMEAASSPAASSAPAEQPAESPAAALPPGPAPVYETLIAEESPDSPPPKIEEPQPEPESPRKSYSVRETKGQSVGAFFQSLLSARPPGAVTGNSSGMMAPEPAPMPPTAASVQQNGGVSFDDFFSAPSAGSSSAAKKDTDPGKDDLDQFQSWLQNLKR